jgi:hypothetical protein
MPNVCEVFTNVAGSRITKATKMTLKKAKRYNLPAKQKQKLDFKLITVAIRTLEITITQETTLTLKPG